MNRETIEILNPAECPGCGACDNCCPVDAIKMQPDYKGFLFPKIDPNKCIHCGRCVESCPALECDLHPASERECYAVMAKDDIRMQSSSGGVFTVLAQYVLKKDGLVCGAAWNPDWTVSHKIISSEEQLDELRRSKYVASQTDHTFTQIKKALDTGKMVLFSECLSSRRSAKIFTETI